MTSSQIVISNNNMSTGNIISNQAISKNGVCSSSIVGSLGNDTISSTGVCNDQLIGGLGADKFVCGQGTDTVRDFNSKEGDIIIDPQNCETIL
jgi:Ca2+-binding RTX toxin-like protein